ncbi:hypothetical protein ACIA49_40945 [Kribbella sp. NPDC051587]|uniref:hypothetical protein n=1 Tax=Kribbella sp. NPDC051587 TaxID=3364119 RepID=UPI0037B5116C
MAGNYWEDEVYSAAPLSGLERTSTSNVFDWLGRTFLSDGGKIDWRSVEAGHTHQRFGDEESLVAAALAEISQRVQPSSTVEHVGDGLSPYGVRFAGGEAISVAAVLLEIPEHHYFLAEDRAWIVVVSTEGDLDVVDRVVAC